MKHSVLPISFILLVCLLTYCGCKRDPEIREKGPSVVLIVVDGPRYTETWGMNGHPYIPNRSGLLSVGVLCSAFTNDGVTTTNPGHAALCTGVYENINNGGLQYPSKPSIFQYWLQATKETSTAAWVIASKDKLEVLSDCTDPSWQGKFRPSRDCGNAGLGSGYRQDSETCGKALSVLSQYHPRLMLINFKQPDAAGHAADSAGYLQGIKDTDAYIRQIWDQLQSDPFYRDQVTLIVTNDHGRHTAGHLDGYASHGDGCEGCRHIEFFAAGPGLKKGYTSTQPYEQRDVSATIARLLNFKMPTSQGDVMIDIFR